MQELELLGKRTTEMMLSCVGHVTTFQDEYNGKIYTVQQDIKNSSKKIMLCMKPNQPKNKWKH